MKNELCEEVLHTIGEAGDTIRELRRTLRRHRLILLLDEIEQLASDNFDPRITDFLRAQGQNENLALCVASQIPLNRLFGAQATNPRHQLSNFHNIFNVKQLASFQETTARAFLTARFAQASLTISNDEMAQLIAQSAGYPSALQTLARQLYQEKMGHA